MDNELISVIIPIYNVCDYLKKCLNSVCGQTYRNLDIILVNDGSTDNSGAICDEYARFDKRITVIHKSNGGLSDARNCGMKVAKGTFYCFIDSDDFIMSETVEKMYYSLKKEKCDMAICNMTRFYEDGTSSVFYQPSKDTVVLEGEERFQTLKQPSVCNKMFKSSLFDNIVFPKGKYYEDTFVYHVLAHRSNRIVLTGYDGYGYLCRKESILGTPKYTDQYFDFIEAVWLRATYLSEQNIEYYADEACLSLYVAYANAKKNIALTAKNKNMFAVSKKHFLYAYNRLIKKQHIRKKQKIRLVLLKYFPYLHGLLY